MLGNEHAITLDTNLYCEEGEMPIVNGDRRISHISPRHSSFKARNHHEKPLHCAVFGLRFAGRILVLRKV